MMIEDGTDEQMKDCMLEACTPRVGERWHSRVPLPRGERPHVAPEVASAWNYLCFASYLCGIANVEGGIIVECVTGCAVQTRSEVTGQVLTHNFSLVEWRKLVGQGLLYQGKKARYGIFC